MKPSVLAMTIALVWPVLAGAQDAVAPAVSDAERQANGHVDSTKRLASSQSSAAGSENPGDDMAKTEADAGPVGAAVDAGPGAEPAAEAIAAPAGNDDGAPADAPAAIVTESAVTVEPAGQPATEDEPQAENAPAVVGQSEVRDAARDEAAAAEALAATPALSSEAQLCLDVAGPADAGVPANAEAAAAHRAALAEVAEACTFAAREDDASAEVLFLAAEVAQAERDLATAFALLERAAGAGLAAAETRLGDYYLFGVAPGGENTEAAIARFQRAADMGDPAGMTTLALMYRVGKGVPRDPGRMVALLEKAAGAGYHFAQYRLGQTFLTGEGLPGRADASLGIPDPARGAALYTAAAEAGNITAALELAALYGDPASGLENDPAARARLTSLASRTGLPEAVAAMGVLYETGDGVGYAPEIAAQLYVRALESGKVGFEALRRGAPAGWDRDTALAFQAILQERGLYTGPLDGIVGGGTAAAARGLAPN